MTKKEQRRLREKVRYERAEKILCELNKRKTRATYGAVGCILGVLPRHVGKYLGCRRPKASWVVRKDTEMPTCYKPCQLAEGLCHSPIIKSCCKLRKWLGLSPASKHRRGCASYSAS